MNNQGRIFILPIQECYDTSNLEIAKHKKEDNSGLLIMIYNTLCQQLKGESAEKVNFL